MDGTSERGLSRPAKAVAAAVLLGGLLAVVALAARGRHPGGHGRLHQREVPTWVSDDLMTLLLVVYVLGAIVVIAAFILMRSTWEEPPTHRRWLRNIVMAGILVGALLVLGRHSIFPTHPRGLNHPPRSTSLPTVATPQRTPTSAAREQRRARVDWILAAAVGGGLLLAAYVLFARRRRDAAGEGAETVEEELAAVVTDTIDDLRSEADPRRAVIAAYARMERVLAQHGQPRHPSEAPFEYLARILLRLRVRAGAVRDLTELFERAKFSTHEIDASMKERAISALLSVRDDLQAAPA